MTLLRAACSMLGSVESTVWSRWSLCLALLLLACLTAARKAEEAEALACTAARRAGEVGEEVERRDLRSRAACKALIWAFLMLGSIITSLALGCLASWMVLKESSAA